VTWRVPLEVAAASPHALVGTVTEIIDQLEANRHRYGFSYITVDAAVIEDFVPVVARLAGH
jgi:hypothetical protein